MKQPGQRHRAAIAQRHRHGCVRQRLQCTSRHTRIAGLPGRAIAQCLPQLQPRSGQAADLFGHRVVPGIRARCGLGACAVCWTTRLARRPDQPGRWIFPGDQYPAAS